MFKPIATGVSACAVILSTAGWVQHMADAQEQPPLVPSQCPGEPAWTRGFNFYERIALSPNQYRAAVVSSDIADVYAGVGFEAEQASFKLRQDDRVSILGEAWDSGCNQWMQVQTDQGVFWMHGNTLADAPEDLGDQRVQEVCPEVTWAGNHLIAELIALAPEQYKTAEITGDGINVRDRPSRASNSPFTLNQAAQVVVMGETFDENCDQWMQVTTDREPGIFWIHGNYVAVQKQVDTGPIDNVNIYLEPDLPLEQTLITNVCPNASWTTGFYFYELIALAPAQHHVKQIVADDVHLRAGVGLDAPTVNRLNRGTPVVVTGEAWDSGCNQWMQVQVDGERNWVSGVYVE
ncbi:MAG: GW dipeptide domain-containing protein [Nodosilinea sp.]